MPFTIAPPGNAHDFCKVNLRLHAAKIGAANDKRKKLLSLTIHQMITIIARCRNICAHGERLYSFKIRKTIPDTSLHEKLKITRKNGQYISGKSDLFAVVIALRYLIGNEDFKIFKRNLLHLVNDTLKKCPHISREQLLNNMGFPKNWSKMLKYKLF